MSIYGNPILLSGGGGLDYSKAIIHVIAPAGSTITFTLSGTTIGELTASDSISDGGDAVYSDYFFPVDTSNYGTITITSSAPVNSKSVTVSAVKLYTVYMPTELNLYNAGTFTSIYTRKTYTQNVTITYEAARIKMAGTKSRTQSAFVIWNNVDLSSFDYVRLYRSNASDNYNRYSCIFITQDPTVETALSASVKTRSNVDSTGSMTSLNISSYTGFWYLGVGFDSNGEVWGNARTEYITRVLLA